MKNDLLMNDMVPLYRQITERIKEAIRNREYKPNERIPGEPELMEFFGVSRITIRKAMTELENEGLLVKKQGKGTFVSNVIVSSTLDELNGYTQTLRRMGYTPGRKLLHREILKEFDDTVREKLNLGPADEIIHIKRLFLADGDPVVLEDAYYPLKFRFLYEEDLNTQSTYTLLKEKGGVIPFKSEKIIGIEHASRDVASYLALKKGYPLLLTHETVFEQNNTPIHYSICRSIGERVKIRMVACASVGVNVSSYELRRSAPAAPEQ
ncbi:GntR family transcriptional regulator [Breznakiella homolactica]|uniref:GntR family transcriptional regulator n=1 Tax=Breznakiella homolactica TaxID=2798577 RepID=A0A7T7XQU4_9SPIR|nr:GntR family transcriptional regulator [Breznakiella homolactica]QQO10779.1 GntR family transcriptional regulator [Breznakiella homolactica]